MAVIWQQRKQVLPVGIKPIYWETGSDSWTNAAMYLVV